MNKLQRKFNRNSNIFIQENAFESIVCEMAAILSVLTRINASPTKKAPSRNFPYFSPTVFLE